MITCDVAYPIDFVITWVDGSDEGWLAERAQWLEQEGNQPWSDWTTGQNRYRDLGLLRYWFRSVERCAPWVNKVHFVTWGHVPDWLNLDHPRLNIVKHSDFIPEEYLPTFNSHTIELNLHRIPRLAEQFVYFNDDMFLMNPQKPDDFFRNGIPRDFASLDARALEKRKTVYEPFNAMVINEHFQKNRVIRAAPSKWLNPIYGVRQNGKTLLLLAWPKFMCLGQDHLPISFERKTFEEVWNAEPAILSMSCACRFRTYMGVSPWLMRDWQRAKGRFVPKRVHPHCLIKLGLDDSRESVDSACDAIAKFAAPTLCLCDYFPTDSSFEIWQRRLLEAFELRFPERSSYEVRT